MAILSFDLIFIELFITSTVIRKLGKYAQFPSQVGFFKIYKAKIILTASKVYIQAHLIFRLILGASSIILYFATFLGRFGRDKLNLYVLWHKSA